MLKIAIPSIFFGILTGSALTWISGIASNGPQLVTLGSNESISGGVYTLNVSNEILELELSGPTLTKSEEPTRDMIMITLPNKRSGNPGTFWTFVRDEYQPGEFSWRVNVETDLSSVPGHSLSSAVRKALGFESRSFGAGSLTDTNNDGIWDNYFESSTIKTSVFIVPA